MGPLHFSVLRLPHRPTEVGRQEEGSVAASMKLKEMGGRG